MWRLVFAHLCTDGRAGRLEAFLSTQRLRERCTLRVGPINGVRDILASMGRMGTYPFMICMCTHFNGQPFPRPIPHKDA
ncbi:hypothetical protein NEOLEDRAFT_718237 [Neolentinus lepideus HHB14362 ss-1]|uniref:Uncharacterized protein n=1 Tax=Neolentinus lepideus HHB14362 ss-1 TaxID=1314782 RepID=A0A165Q5E9_9AGAM|nr:hypothetical protein NEOLEDRAFT_718237 [Neolentinus lepideus HHB14362 ss-1]